MVPLSPVDLPRSGIQKPSPSQLMEAKRRGPGPLPPGTGKAGEAEVLSSFPAPVNVLGLPIVPWRKAEVILGVDSLIRRGSPAFFITANLHYARLSARLDDLQKINARAAFIVADGMPLVWVARWQGTPLPERITGADLIWDLSELAAAKGYPIYLLGGRPGVAEEAARRLKQRFPRLIVAGTSAPVLEKLDPLAEMELIQRIKSSGAKLLFAAFGQPKGERWLAGHLDELGVPVAVQVGAAFDFAAGRIRRAPRALQRLGLEWAFRLLCDPRRLLPRYWADGWFFLQELRKLFRHRRRMAKPHPDVNSPGTPA